MQHSKIFTGTSKFIAGCFLIIAATTYSCNDSAPASESPSDSTTIAPATNDTMMKTSTDSLMNSAVDSQTIDTSKTGQNPPPRQN